MGRVYPGRIPVDELLKHVGLDGPRAVQAVRGLFEGGLIAAEGATCPVGMPGSAIRLTEPGMVVAFGLASIEEDA
ncbi:MAG: hypothetical protein ABI564_02615, partial [Ideonella sp.]